MASIALGLWTVVFPVIGATSDNPPVKAARSPAEQTIQARRFFLDGKFEDALAIYNVLASAPGTACLAAIGRADIDLARVEIEAGILRLREFEKRCQASSDWHTRMAALLSAAGQYSEAIRENREALRIKPANMRARRQLGETLERTGEWKKAIEAYRPFDEAMAGDRLPDDAESVTDLGLGFYRYSVLTKTNLVQRTRHILDEVFGAVTASIDEAYWPARIATAQLLLEKHNLPDALAEFKAIHSPAGEADATEGICRIHLEQWEFDECESLAATMLASHSKHVGLLQVMAELRMTERKYAEAADIAERALKINPNREAALGLLAAAQLRQGDADAARRAEQRVTAFNKNPAVFHFIVGQWLSAARQYPEAEAHFKRAMEFAPFWPEPRTSLGQLYMETGDEPDARKALEASFELDGFNQHTFNVLGLLDRLDRFSQIESEHFIVKFDPGEDAIIAPYFSRALEGLYDEVCDDFETRPTGKTIIELFPDHEGFSVRITGRPFIGTIGACTGPVIAMAAPRGRPPFGRFNWAGVLRHEFTHTVTLAATKNRIPHWMTEGLAVYEEPTPRSWRYKQILADALRRNQLFTLQSIDWGFARPRRPDDRMQAYAQSEWMMEFIIHRWRYAAVIELLHAFRDGLTQPAAFERVLKIKPDDFDRDFRTWAGKEAQSWGLPLSPVADAKALEEKLKDSPDDAALWAEAAQSHWLDGDYKKALVAATKALRLDERNVTALEIAGRIHVAHAMSESDEAERRKWMQEATPLIERLVELSPDHPTGILFMGYLEQSDEQWTEALARYRDYQKRVPDDPDSYRRSAAIYLRRKQFPQALQQLEALFRLVEDEPAVARQIARIYADRQDWSKTAQWYRKALQIDPYDVDIHGALADALAETGKWAEAEQEYQVVVKLLPNEAIGYEGLARAYKGLGNPEKAKTYKERAAALAGRPEEPDHHEPAKDRQ